ncbi:hypothetical protein [Pleionea litopenaei]|uniref:Uncharacterized protein n=1 Tax=Pleionea litopenaei TaxID=3070815 RepID=A0AA51RWV7_9GAMM|nr:hypothetical protein [Pleionea sp. HL-JVS1]WMS88918.1 hypothetical protein Q9312_08375 [Pleionea sp. HL-JVS1]
MKTYIEPCESDEVIWMFLTLLTVPVEQQILLLEGNIPCDKLKNSEKLLGIFYDFSNGWFDENHPKTESFGELVYFIESNDFDYSIESFRYDSKWKKLRELAKKSLVESGLEPWPLPKDRIELSDFTEF